MLWGRDKFLMRRCSVPRCERQGEYFRIQVPMPPAPMLWCEFHYRLALMGLQALETEREKREAQEPPPEGFDL